MTEAGQERLAVELRDRELARQRESDPDGIQSADTPRTIAGDVLASDWLAERDARMRRQALDEAVEAIRAELRNMPYYTASLNGGEFRYLDVSVEGAAEGLTHIVASLRDDGEQ